MQKLKRILALIGAIALLGLYIATLIIGLMGRADMKGLLSACIVCTVLIPVTFYAIILTAKILGRNAEEAAAETDEKSKD